MRESAEKEVKEGFLIDADYITVRDASGKKKAVIRLWCKDIAGRDFVVFDGNFEPYFYVFPRHLFNNAGNTATTKDACDSAWDIEEKKRELERICVRSGGERIRPKRVEVCTRKVFGVPCRGLRVVAEYPKDVPVLREEIQRRDESCVALEADILFAIRYLVDKDLRLFDGICVEGKRLSAEQVAEKFKVAASVSVEEAFLAERVMWKHLRRPPLRILAFDCEMASPYGMPSPKRDPIIIISCAFKEARSGVEGGEIHTKMFTLREDEAKTKDDSRIIREFVQFVRDFRPDVIVGYNTDAFDWHYLKERARIHGIKLNIGKDGSELSVERGGVSPEVNIAGVLNVDLYKIARRDLSEVKVKTLENVAEFLGAMRKIERESLTPREIYDFSRGSEEERGRLRAYAIADAVSALKIAERLLPLQIELSHILRCPLDLLANMGRGRQVEALLLSEAFKRGELVPQRREGRAESYEGGFVLPPKKGLHENVISLDFSSMYPSIMLSFNISPDTFVPPEAVKNKDDFYIAPEVGHAFRKHPDGFFKQILSELVEKRREIKRRMEEVAEKEGKDSQEARILDVQQHCLKILTNAFYGYTGWSAAKFYRKECAEATTAWGRYFIKKAIKMAESLGFDVIYGDTDSIFAKLSGEATKEEIIKRAKELADAISSEWELAKLEIKEFFKTIFFTGKKKRYAALTEDGEIVVRGLEARRGDWCELAKEVQMKVIEIILRRKDAKLAAEYVRNVIEDLRSGKIPIEKLIIYKTLTKKIEGYETKQAHVVAAKVAKDANVIYEIGSKIPYVIVCETVLGAAGERGERSGIGGDGVKRSVVKGGGVGKAKERKKRAKRSGIGGAGEDKTSERAFPIEIAVDVRGNEIRDAMGRSFHIDTDYYVHKQIIPAAVRILQIFGYDASYFAESPQKNLSIWL